MAHASSNEELKRKKSKEPVQYFMANVLLKNELTYF